MQLLMLLSLSLLLVLIAFSQSNQALSKLNEVNGVLGFSQDVDRIVSIVQSDIDKLDEEFGEFNGTINWLNQIKVWQHFKNACIEVHQIENHYETISRTLLFWVLQDDYRNNSDVFGIIDHIMHISVYFETEEMVEKSENQSLLSFAQQITRESQAIYLNVDFYLELLGRPFPRNQTLNVLRQKYEVHSKQMCHISQSPQQYIYSLYMEIALAELKAYVMIEYALLIQRVSGQNNLIETNKVRLNYKNIIENALDSVIKAMQKADRVVWRCDPEEHKHNVTYDEVTRLLQGYIENEVDLNSEGSCAQACFDYQNTTTKGCFDQQFCSQQPKCAGRIHNCQFIDSYLSVCQSPESNNRRYEYIQNNDGKRFGDSEACWREVNRVESWNRWLFWQCSYCFCLCDEPSLKSDRYFNLRETISDVKANKVVTGVRFVKKNRIFHLQIQQGERLPRGAVNKSTVEWKPVHDYKISDSNITEGVDYHEMSFEKRAIDLDEILNTHQRTSVVTGLRFRVVSGRLNLKVRFSYFDFAKGQLLEPEVISTWQTHQDVKDRQKLNIDNLDLPTRSVWGSQPMSKDNQYLEFVNSGIEADASQSTIPFIDIQDVVINPPAPLSGIGIYYKSSKNYGGFVAPKIISYDLSQHLRNL